MELAPIIYHPLMEEEKSVSGWTKCTIDYIHSNRSKVDKLIRSIAASLSKKAIQSADVEDIISEITLYLYKSDDYNISKAVERSNSGNVVSIEGYINSCIKFCVIRYMTTSYKLEKNILREKVDNDGRELSLFDIIPDECIEAEFENLLMDLYSYCKLYENMRYKYGHDIYLIFYIRLITLNDKSNDSYREVMNILGISKKELALIEKKAAEDEVLINLAKAISHTSIDEAIETIEQFVYSADNIKEVIYYMC